MERISIPLGLVRICDTWTQTGGYEAYCWNWLRGKEVVGKDLRLACVSVRGIDFFGMESARSSQKHHVGCAKVRVGEYGHGLKELSSLCRMHRICRNASRW